jgi:hypothetical protein
MQESSLHKSLKDLYTQPGDRQEVSVGGYLVDVLHGETVIEVQTRNFSMIKNKLLDLVENHPVLLVHPVAVEKWIVHQESSQTSRRRSPRRGRVEDIFYELVRLPKITLSVNFAFEAVFIKTEEVRKNDGLGSWRRRGQSIVDRRLLEVLSRQRFDRSSDYAELLPVNLGRQFTIKELSESSGLSPALAKRMAYCLRQMEQIHLTGKRGRAYVYERS